MRAEVVIICSFAVAVLLFLSNFRICGAFGEILRGIQLGIFGAAGYVMPLVLFVGTCFYLSNKGNIHAAVKLAAVIALVFTICGLLQLLFGKMNQEGSSLLEYYRLSSINGAGGGLLGGVLTSLLIMALGRVGAYLVLIVLFIICMVCITERSFVSVVKKGGDKAYQYAREDMDRRRELHAQRSEERRRLREEQKVRGVNFSATNLSDSREDYDEEEFDREFGADLEEIPGPSPADEFRGRFEPPISPSAENAVKAEKEDVNALASAIESHSRPTPKPVVTGIKVEDEFGIHEEDGRSTIRVQRDSRTLEEMDMGGPSGETGSLELREESAAALKGTSREAEVASWDVPQTGRAAAWSAQGAGDSAGRDTQETGKSASWDVPQAGETTSWDTPQTEDAVPWDAPEDIKSVPWDVPEDTETSQEDTYISDTSEQGVNYDSIFVPEAPKRVVTASGKVIETETEFLQKKLEKQGGGARGNGAGANGTFANGAAANGASANGAAARNEAAASKNGGAATEAAGIAVAQEIQKKEEEVKKEYVFPPTSLLKKGTRKSSFSEDEYRATAIKLQQTLRNFGVGVTVTNISCGPSVTRYELLPEQGVKVSRIVSLTDDIKLSLAAADIRIEAPIPGKSAVGIEVPNKENNTVYLRDLLESETFINHKSRLAFAVGKDIGGQVVVTDIAKMPHLLIAGATGSGKSVCINTLIMSLIFKSKPEDVKLIMVDPKVVELSVYNGIPHLLIPVVTDPKKASGALSWATAEMDSRYKKFAECNVRDLKGYNDRVEKLKDVDDPNKPEKLPQIVIIIDELADLMMVAPGEVEDSICRLAQLARAAGIHLVIATQRPSVNVITGLIKANVPSRIAFSVSSGGESRIIIDMNGAEKLLGKGDMLFYPAGYPKPQRVQGAFVSDEEIAAFDDMQFDAVVANPPFSAEWSAADKFNNDDRFSKAGRLAPKKTADYAFILHMVHHLNEGGTMACVAPHGVLFRGNAEGVIRRFLIEKKNYIDAIIGLPANIFYGTSIPTCILVLKKCRKEDDNILFIDASKEFEKVKTQNKLRPQHIQKIVETYRDRKEIEKYSHLATLQEVAENDYNLNIPRYVDTFEEEEPIDIKAVMAEIKELDATRAELDKEIEGYLKELGLVE